MKQNVKRLFGILLALCLIAGFMPGAVNSVLADGDKVISGLGTGTIGQSTYNDMYTVYFGSKKTPILFNVLNKNETSFGGQTMLLDCASIIKTEQRFHNSLSSVSWADSYIRACMQGSIMTDNFITQEIEAIADSIKSENTDSPLNGDKLFLLDKKEAIDDYCYRNRDSIGVYW